MEWISVKDRLPESNDTHLIIAGVTKWYDVCHYDLDRGVWYDCIDYDDVDGVTHWMPLPEPPKE
jgi:hypothetical protein